MFVPLTIYLMQQRESGIGDPEMAELAKEEIQELQTKSVQLEERLKILLLPADPLDERNIMLEVVLYLNRTGHALTSYCLIQLNGQGDHNSRYYDYAHGLLYQISKQSCSSIIVVQGWLSGCKSQ